MIGFICGLFCYSFFSKSQSSNELQEQLDTIGAEREQQEEDIKEHLHQTYEQLKQLTQQVNIVNQTWNKSAENLLDSHTLKELSTLGKTKAQPHVTIEASATPPQDFPSEDKPFYPNDGLLTDNPPLSEKEQSKETEKHYS